MNGSKIKIEHQNSSVLITVFVLVTFVLLVVYGSFYFFDRYPNLNPEVLLGGMRKGRLKVWAFVFTIGIVAIGLLLACIIQWLTVKIDGERK